MAGGHRWVTEHKAQFYVLQATPTFNRQLRHTIELNDSPEPNENRHPWL